MSTTPTDRITPADLKAKLGELQAGLESTVESTKNQLVGVAIAVGVGVVAVAFLLGRRGGRRKTTVIEITRA